MKILHVFALAAIAFAPTTVVAQSPGSAEDIQFRSIDFENQILELHNFGSDSLDLDGWRFCTHDVSDGFDYTSATGLNGFSLEAGESLRVHWNDDASGDDAINISSLGGRWIDDLSVNGSGDGISLNLYRDSSFGNADSIVDHIQYSLDGSNVGGQSNPRGAVAVNGELWGSTADWISVSEESTSLVLEDEPFPLDSGATHTSSSYAVNVSAVPEPSSLIALCLGVFGIASRRRRS